MEVAPATAETGRREEGRGQGRKGNRATKGGGGASEGKPHQDQGGGCPACRRGGQGRQARSTTCAGSRTEGEGQGGNGGRGQRSGTRGFFFQPSFSRSRAHVGGTQATELGVSSSRVGGGVSAGIEESERPRAESASDKTSNEVSSTDNVTIRLTAVVVKKPVPVPKANLSREGDKRKSCQRAR